MWFIVVDVEQETSAPPPKKNPGSAPVMMASASIAHEAVGRLGFRLRDREGERNNCFSKI